MSSSDTVKGGMKPSDDEKALIARAKCGDRRAFDTLLELHRPRTTAVCRRFFASLPAEAEDMVQITFLRALDKINAFKGEANFSTWLHTIARRLCLDRLQELNGKYGEYIGDVPGNATGSTKSEDIFSLQSDSAPSPEQVVLLSEQVAFRSTLLQKTREQLDEREWTILVLLDYGKMTSAKVGHLLNISEGRVRQLHARAKTKARKVWRECQDRFFQEGAIAKKAV